MTLLGAEMGILERVGEADLAEIPGVACLISHRFVAQAEVLELDLSWVAIDLNNLSQ